METASHPTSGYLQNEFLKRRTRNPAYSLRAFARFLEIPSGRLSEIFSEKRKITRKLAGKIADRLALAPEERLRFIPAVTQKTGGDRHPRINGEAETQYQQLSVDTFHVISAWYHYAILSLVEVDDFQPQPKWMAHRLGISVVEARMGLARLLRLGLIEKVNGTVIRTTTQVTTSHDVVSGGLRKFHKQTLEKAIDSLEEVGVTLRDITSMTMAIDVKKLPKAKKMIKQFRRRMARILEVGNKNAVYTLNVQLLPLTKIDLNHNGKGTRK